MVDKIESEYICDICIFKNIYHICFRSYSNIGNYLNKLKKNERKIKQKVIPIIIISIIIAPMVEAAQPEDAKYTHTYTHIQRSK